jgi:three-Cys-motif partner protein
VEIPSEYEGREQTFLKHRVLREYLSAWGHKLGSAARYRPVRLRFVDCFAGPWQARHQDLEDTSIAIGLGALEEAAKTWTERGHRVDVGALFVEPNDSSYARLEEYLATRGGAVTTRAFHGEFGDHVRDIQRCIGSDSAFVFVDPTGWRGAAMRFIAPLMGGRRDVMVNVMFNHVNRFKDDARPFLREQMKEFFGLTDRDLPADLSEEDLVALYRAQLKEKCHIRFAADLAIPHPTHDRTWFRLVVGGSSSAILELFRDIERRVVGQEAGAVRDAAARRQREERGPQLDLDLAAANPDRRYERLHAADLARVPAELIARLHERSPVKFVDLWPPVLEGLHVRKTEVARAAWGLVQSKAISARGLGPREKTIKDGHWLSLSSGSLLSLS